MTALDVLGLAPEHEAVYREVLCASLTVPQLASTLGLSDVAVAEAVRVLVAAGLVERRGDHAVARPPSEAVARLLAERARALDHTAARLDSVRDVLPDLQATYLRGGVGRGDPVGTELVPVPDTMQLLHRMTTGGRGELLFLRPDQWKLPFHPELDAWLGAMVRSGRKARAIYPTRVLEEAPQVLWDRAASGERVRILADVPMRLAVLGEDGALLQEVPGVPESKVLVLYPPAAVAALAVLFESLWVRALPVPGLDETAPERPRHDRRMLVEQLASGARDEQIARALGLSLRTVRRRVAALLEELGVESRFQAGVEATRRGWVRPSGPS